MDLENWFVDLMKTLENVRDTNEQAGASNYTFSLFFTKEEIERITNEYRKTQFIEIY